MVRTPPGTTQNRIMKSPGNAVSSEGVLLGFEQLDGKIPGGKYVSVSIELKVVRDSDIEKLYNTKNGKATAKMWNLIQEYSDPQFFLHEYHKKMNSIYYMKKLKGKKYRKLVNLAKKQAAGCSNDYEKMQKISKYLAQSIYYDYPYFEGKSKYTNLNPYDIWKNKKTICQGYTTLYWVMLDAIDIPCMLIYSRYHVYNAAYDKNSDRWVFIDVTWCSGNRYDGENKWIEGEYNDSYFDMSLEYMLSIPNHEIFNVEGVLKKKVYYELGVSKGSGPTASYTNMNKWRWNVAVKKKSNAKTVSKIAGIRVKK